MPGFYDAAQTISTFYRLSFGSSYKQYNEINPNLIKITCFNDDMRE
jgi:hypothetical protein